LKHAIRKRTAAMARSRQVEKAVPKGTELRKQAGAWLQERRKAAGLSQIDLAQRLGLKYYTFVSQVENGFGRVPTDTMEAWARALGLAPGAFARHLLAFYEPELHRLLFERKT
jgi:transcriptional regulator with XRE-family HTH domain